MAPEHRLTMPDGSTLPAPSRRRTAPDAEPQQPRPRTQLAIPALPDWPAAMREERAAAYLDVSETYFRTRIAPELPPVRPSARVILYRRRDLDAWLDRQAGIKPASHSGSSWDDL